MTPYIQLGIRLEQLPVSDRNINMKFSKEVVVLVYLNKISEIDKRKMIRYTHTHTHIKVTLNVVCLWRYPHRMIPHQKREHLIKVPTLLIIYDIL